MEEVRRGLVLYEVPERRDQARLGTLTASLPVKSG